MIKSIFIRGWFMLMITVNPLSIGAPNKIREKCLSGSDKCYTLFRADFTWQEAYDECLHRNQHLATIQDAQTQSIMEKFAKDQEYSEGAAHAWVAGRRSNDTTWRYLNGTAFNHTGTILKESDFSRLCMLLNGQSGLGSDANLHLAVPCKNNAAYKAVCEYDPQGGNCPNDDKTIHQPSVNKCNTVSGVRYRSWHDARQHCQSHGWELTHTGAGSWDFYNKLTLTDKQLIRDENALWIGAQRKAWVWKTGESSEVYPAVTYWRTGEGMNVLEDCMHIELNDIGLWADKGCDATSAYFICQDYQDQPIQDTKTTKTPTTITTTTNTPTTNTPSTITPTESQILMSTVYIIVGMVIVGVLVAVSIIVAVVFARRKVRKESSPVANANSNTGPSRNTTHADINNEDPQPYAEFTAESRPTEDSPYVLPLYEEAAAVPGDKQQMLEVYDKVSDVKAPGHQGSSRVDPGHGTAGVGVFAPPMKNKDTTLDDDLQIVDNEMYGAGLDYPIRNRDTNPDDVPKIQPMKNQDLNSDDLEIVDNDMYGAPLNYPIRNTDINTNIPIMPMENKDTNSDDLEIVDNEMYGAV